jgi:hypothetical protein
MVRKRILVIGLSALVLAASATIALAQNTGNPSFDGAYRGSLVCDQLPGTHGILRAPLDMTVNGGNVVAARPIFNLDGSRVVGTEIAIGTVGTDGALHLTSNWAVARGSFKGTYSGTLAATGGTVTGPEEWTRSPTDGGNATRMCYGAYVKGPSQERNSHQ